MNDKLAYMCTMQRAAPTEENHGALDQQTERMRFPGQHRILDQELPALEEVPTTLAHAWRQFASAAGIRHPAGDPEWSGRLIGAFRLPAGAHIAPENKVSRT